MEKSLVDLAIRGNKHALELLLNKNRKTALIIALKYIKNQNDAEDIVQNAFVKVFLNIKKFRNESAFSTWLFRIIYIESVRYRTDKKKQPYNIVNDYIDEYDCVDIEDEERVKNLVKDAMDILTETEHTIISLFYLSEKSIIEISKITNHSQSNIKVKLHRARKKMQSFLIERDGK